MVYQFTTDCIIKVGVRTATGFCGDLGGPIIDLGATMTTSITPANCGGGAPYFEANVPASPCPIIPGPNPRVYPTSATMAVSE